MTTACSLCASTDGPFLQEPTGLRESPYFYKCQKCSVDNKYTTFKDTVGMNPSKASINEYFYICPGCTNLYYMTIPYANLRYDVKVCPSCGTRRMADSVALLVDDILPYQPMRQWGLSILFPLRFPFQTTCESALPMADEWKAIYSASRAPKLKPTGVVRAR